MARVALGIKFPFVWHLDLWTQIFERGKTWLIIQSSALKICSSHRASSCHLHGIVCETSVLQLITTYSRLSGRTGNQILVQIDWESVLFTFVQTVPADLAVTYRAPVGSERCLGKRSWNGPWLHRAHSLWGVGTGGQEKKTSNAMQCMGWTINRFKRWPSRCGQDWPKLHLREGRGLSWVGRLEMALEGWKRGPYVLFFSLLPREFPNGNSYIAGLLSAWAKDSGFLSARASWFLLWSCPSTHWPAARQMCSSRKTLQMSGREVIPCVLHRGLLGTLEASLFQHHGDSGKEVVLVLLK